MSDPRTFDQPYALDDEEAEVVDALPVGAGPPPPPPEPVRPASSPVLASPVAQVAAVAATGFAIGAATMAVARRHKAKKLARRPRAARSLDDIVGSRTFLVDVHLLNRG